MLQNPQETILIVGTSHDAYQIRPRSGPQDGANAFKKFLLETVQRHAAKTIAEEMSTEALRRRTSVGREVANEGNLVHIYCDPTCAQRRALGISKQNTPEDDAKREQEWLRRLGEVCRHPVLFLCGGNHVASFAQLSRSVGFATNVLNRDFEAPIPLDQRII